LIALPFLFSRGFFWNYTRIKSARGQIFTAKTPSPQRTAQCNQSYHETWFESDPESNQATTAFFMLRDLRVFAVCNEAA